MPEAGVCVATGFNNLVAIDIDDDELVAPILAVLPEGFVGKVGRKGLTAFLRSAEPMPSTPYDDANGHRLIDFLSVGRQSVIPDTNHPDTGRPYEWTTERTLLNTLLAELPVFTSAHRAEMESRFQRYSPSGRNSIRPGSFPLGGLCPSNSGSQRGATGMGL
jgi:hypothetical protein